MAIKAETRHPWDVQGRLEYDAQWVQDAGKRLSDPGLARRGQALSREVERLAKHLREQDGTR